MSEKILTKKEAWLLIAEEWRHTENDGYGIPRTVNSYSSGMCVSIELNPHIDSSTQTKMLKKIKKFSDNNQYLFPRTKEGAKQRVQFCLDRAAEL